MKLLKFYADWCAPCKALSAVIKESNHPHELVEVNADEDFTTLKKYNVKGLPTLVLLDDDGEEVNRSNGLLPASVFNEEYVTPYV